LLWGEREICSVANLTRADGHEFLQRVAAAPLQVKTTLYSLEDANKALADLRDGVLTGAAVLIP
jgi:propanol-preferring alcohol dehydrogenase